MHNHNSNSNRVQRAQPNSNQIELSTDEIESLIDRLDRNKLSAEDIETLKAIVCNHIHFQQMLEEKNITIKKLLREFGFGGKSEKSKDILKDSASDSDSDSDSEPGRGDNNGNGGNGGNGGNENENVDNGENENENENENEEEKKKKKGHGRNGASCYTGAEKIYVPHPDLKVGDECPDCPKGKGRLFKYNRLGKVIRIKGQPPIVATVYELEKLRCSSCLKIFTTPIPPEAGDKKYDEEAGAQICLLKYGNGFAFNRLKNFQNNFGIPLALATQWEIVKGAGVIGELIYEALIDFGAQGGVIYNDDTHVTILSIKKEIKEKELESKGGKGDKGDKGDDRTGTFTTGIVSKVDGREIALYMTGRNHAGENLEEVLRRRKQSLPPPIQMCDAEPKNIPKNMETIIANCLAHGRRKFVTLLDVFPDECRIVIGYLADVYKNESIAKEKSLTPPGRLQFHQRESGPIMEKLKNWLDRQFAEKRVEENSSLGKVIRYMQNHWNKLTLFLRVEGAPLDSNLVEQALKISILNRKNAYFFKTENGAKMGDIFMSIIQTCYKAKVNAFEYLVVLQKNAESVRKEPQNWLPWNFKDTLEKMTR